MSEDRLARGFELYNAGEFDALREFIHPDVIVERAGELPPLHGWEAFRELQEPDAFEWQRLHALSLEISGEKALVHVRMHARGAGSGLELDVYSWQVWTIRDGLVARIQTFTDESDARVAAGLGKNDSP